VPEHSSGKKNRKFSRNSVKCSKYKSEHRRTKNNPLRTPRPDESTPHPAHSKVDRAPRPPKRAAFSPYNVWRVAPEGKSNA
jgi:hypothetical protein